LFIYAKDLFVEADGPPRPPRRGLISALERGNSKMNVGVLVGCGQLCCGGLCLGTGVMDDDTPVISSASRWRARRVQAMDEYDENVRHVRLPGAGTRVDRQALGRTYGLAVIVSGALGGLKPGSCYLKKNFALSLGVGSPSPTETFLRILVILPS